MTTKKKIPNEPSNTKIEQEDKCLQLSTRLNEAINTLLLLPEFQAIARKQGDAEATMAITKLLRQTRPELFDQTNAGDGIAFLFSGME